MTVASDTPSFIQIPGNGTATSFAFPFKIFQASDLIVGFITSNGYGQQTSGFTVQNVDVNGGGNVVFTTAPPSGTTVDIRSVTPKIQNTEFANLGSFLPESHTEAFDRLTRMVQDLYRLAYTFGVHGPDQEGTAWTALPSAKVRASQMLTFDGNGMPLCVPQPVAGAVTRLLIGGLLYPILTGETGVADTSYPYGWLPRFGAKIDGSTNDTTAINNAIASAKATNGFVYHPGGNCVHASQILFGTNVSIRGYDRTACVFTYTGPAGSSGWRHTNNGTSSPTINTSGFGRVNFEGVTITTAVASSTAAALELNACGYSFYVIRNCRFTGTFKHGVILDGTEIVSLQSNIMDNGNGIANSTNIWITDGPDRTLGQSVGFSNRITIDASNQINGAQYGIVDDGGSDHSISHNNINGNSVPIVMAAVESFVIDDNEMENAGVQTGSANILFQTTTLFGGANVGPCQGGRIEDNFFGADMAGSSTSLKFAGASMHQGISVRGNWFRGNLGLSADIDVTKLSNSICAQNYVSSTKVSGGHYTGVHNDADGNILMPPQNGFGGAFAQNAYIWGDTRFRHQFVTAIQMALVRVIYSASMTFDARLGNFFQIIANNNTAFTINNPTGDGTNGNDGTTLWVQLLNTSAGALGAITAGGAFKLSGGAWPSPASGQYSIIQFMRDETRNFWYEVFRATGLPN